MHLAKKRETKVLHMLSKSTEEPSEKTSMRSVLWLKLNHEVYNLYSISQTFSN